jgi:hypothetical protein
MAEQHKNMLPQIALRRAGIQHNQSLEQEYGGVEEEFNCEQGLAVNTLGGGVAGLL